MAKKTKPAAPAVPLKLQGKSVFLAGNFYGQAHILQKLIELEGGTVVKELADARLGWLADNAKVGLPAMDYSVGVATGEVLAGEVGTDRIHFWDVIGAPVNLAFRLCALAIDRRTPNLVDAVTIEGAAAGAGKRCVEVDAAELGGKRQRLFRLDA